MVKLTAKHERIRKPEVTVDYNKTMGDVDLVSRVIIHTLQFAKARLKWYELSVYNSFIIFRKLNFENNIMTHLLFQQALIEELTQFHSYESNLLQTASWC